MADCFSLNLLLYADCPSDIDEMLTVIPAGLPQYNATGELVCTNGGALFLNNVSVSNATMCNATAQWTTLDDIKCYTGSVNWFAFTVQMTKNAAHYTKIWNFSSRAY